MTNKETPAEHASNVTVPMLRLNKDSSPADLKTGEVSFALNATTDSLTGDKGRVCNEHSNIEYASLPLGSQLLHSIYIGDNEFAVFLYNTLTAHSEIGVFYEEKKKYVTKISDKDSATKLNITLESKIKATYRLRQGCEKNIYFVDGVNRPRKIDFSNLAQYFTGDDIILNKLNLQKVILKYPDYEDITVEEAGELEAGSYILFVQYLDEDLNPTECVSFSQPIQIYHGAITDNFEVIRGSTNKKTFYQDYPATNKNLKVVLSNLDTSFKYYRVGVVAYTSGTGEISKIVFLPKKTTNLKTTLVTTLSSGVNIATLAEIQAIRATITGAKDIAQLENRLVLANTKGDPIDFCELQQYASRIQSNFTTTNVRLNDISSLHNPKRATLKVEGSGYMPGEIYSFDIMYHFEGGVVSPTYHIPGKAVGDANSNMSTNNLVVGSTYVDRPCLSGDYWGVDAKGENLKDQTVRHHRFPTREEAGIGFVTKVAAGSSVNTFALQLQLTGVINPSAPTTLTFDITYTKGGTPETETFSLDKNSYSSVLGFTTTIDSSENTIVAGTITETSTPASGLFPFLSAVESTTTLVKDIYQAPIMGIEFSNIVKPVLSTGQEAIGYTILRRKRDEANKTVHDTGILFPTIKEIRPDKNIFSGIGIIFPDVQSNEIQSDLYGLYNPEFKFKKKEARNFNKIRLLGYYGKNGRSVGQQYLEDVQPGTSYNAQVHRKREKDTDGFSLRAIFRWESTAYTPITPIEVPSSNIQKIGYLNALDSVEVQETGGGKRQLYNVSADNRFGYVHLTGNLPLDIYGASLTPSRLPYIQIYRDFATPYANYDIDPSYPEHSDVKLFSSVNAESCVLYNGDVTITSVEIVSSMFKEIRMKARAFKKVGFFKAVLGGILAAVGTVLSFTGVGLVAGAAIISAGLSLLSSGIKKEQMIKAYGDLYEKGLKDTCGDNFTDSAFPSTGTNTFLNGEVLVQEDDEIQWFVDSANLIWLESSVNQSLRIGNNKGFPDFLPSPYTFNADEVKQYVIDKVTDIDFSRDMGRVYTSIPSAEFFELNLDYQVEGGIKPFFTLPTEYECCSECVESFPHRVHWSEQSFQEEKEDNYTVLLPNNYVDIEGETGEIKHLIKQNNKVYIQTEEAVWVIPQSLQERVVGETVSYLGTGEFLSLPPQKLVDADSGQSNGSGYNGTYLKTPYGTFFVSDLQSGVYWLKENSIEPLHVKGMYTFFKDNLDFVAIKQLREFGVQEYQYLGNTSAKMGIGYTLAYDPRKERILLTKKDFKILNTEILTVDSDFWIENYNNVWYYYPSVTQTIEAYNDAHPGENWKLVSIKEGNIQIVKSYLEADYRGVLVQKTAFQNIPGQVITLQTKDLSYTLSYDLASASWQSFMSYTPSKYISSKSNFYSFLPDFNSIWKHNIVGSHQKFYNIGYNFTIDYSSITNPLLMYIWEFITLYTKAKKFSAIDGQWVEAQNVTFNKAILYNDVQATGEVEFNNILPNGSTWYNLGGKTLVLSGSGEEGWTINNIKDFRKESEPLLWDTSIDRSDYLKVTDKSLNVNAIDENKPWYSVEPLRGKYLGIRLIFNTFEDTTLLFNYSVEPNKQSI